MFYIKTKISDSCEIRTAISDENIFTTCPICGKELQVDFFDGVNGHEMDLYGTAIFCEKCAHKDEAIKRGPVLLPNDSKRSGKKKS